MVSEQAQEGTKHWRGLSWDVHLQMSLVTWEPQASGPLGSTPDHPAHPPPSRDAIPVRLDYTPPWGTEEAPPAPAPLPDLT